jgi:hypothetical protein
MAEAPIQHPVLAALAAKHGAVHLDSKVDPQGNVTLHYAHPSPETFRGHAVDALLSGGNRIVAHQGGVIVVRDPHGKLWAVNVSRQALQKAAPAPQAPGVGMQVAATIPARPKKGAGVASSKQVTGMATPVASPIYKGKPCPRGERLVKAAGGEIADAYLNGETLTHRVVFPHGTDLPAAASQIVKGLQESGMSAGTDGQRIAAMSGDGPRVWLLSTAAGGA